MFVDSGAPKFLILCVAIMSETRCEDASTACVGGYTPLVRLMPRVASSVPRPSLVEVLGDSWDDIYGAREYIRAAQVGLGLLIDKSHGRRGYNPRRFV